MSIRLSALSMMLVDIPLLSGSLKAPLNPKSIMHQPFFLKKNLILEANLLLDRQFSYVYFI